MTHSSRPEGSLAVERPPQDTMTSDGRSEAPRWSPLGRSTGAVVYLAFPPTTVLAYAVDDRRTVSEVRVRPALGDHPHLIERLRDRVVVQTVDDRTVMFGDDRRPRSLGRSLVFLPSPPHAVWLVTGDALATDGRMRVRHVRLDGRVTVPLVRIPTGYLPVGGRGRRVMLWDERGLWWWRPATGAVRATAGAQVLDVGATVTVTCDEYCSVASVHSATGRRRVRAGQWARFEWAALSPDERCVALVTFGRRSTLLVLDRTIGAVSVVAKGRLAVHRRLAWSADGRFLFFATRAGELAVFDVAGGTTAMVSAEIGTAHSFAVGAAP